MTQYAFQYSGLARTALSDVGSGTPQHTTILTLDASYLMKTSAQIIAQFY